MEPCGVFWQLCGCIAAHLEGNTESDILVPATRLSVETGKQAECRYIVTGYDREMSTQQIPACHQTT